MAEISFVTSGVKTGEIKYARKKNIDWYKNVMGPLNITPAPKEVLNITVITKSSIDFKINMDPSFF